MTPLQAVAEAMAVHQRGELELAEQLYDKILEAHPQEPNALQYRGVLRLHQRRHEEGLALIRQSLAIDPGNAHAWNNLGNGLRVSGDREAACAAFEEALRLAPHLHLVSFNLGTLLVRLARYREAIAAFERAAEGRPDYDDAYENLGRLYYRFNEIDKAHATYLKWLQMAPEHPVALHMAAATAPAGAPPPARATDEYVRRAFDEFAHGFDESLAGLGYRAPQLVTTAPGCQPEALRTAPAILDAGCGTGLCGPLLRPLASRLDGVDLSEKVVELAA